jgi:tRNA (adenine22-N1)-methyltransferase
MVDRFYGHIWDCCCDHGFLGLHLLRRGTGNTIHFVDILEHLMSALEAELNASNIERLWKVHCLDVNDLPLLAEEVSSVASPNVTNTDDHLIIIAGVGGERLIELVKGIISKHPNKQLEFLLCPVHHNYKVREFLKSQNMGLLKEVLITENRRFYEVLHVSTEGGQEVSLVGDDMWDLHDSDHQLYLQRTIEHYRNKMNDCTMDASRIVKAYQMVGA